MLIRLLTLILALPLLVAAPAFATDYDVANADIWPSQNDVAQTAGNGKKLLENQWQKAIVAITETNFVSTGCALPASSANLNISVPACQALINGRLIDIPGSTSITASASATNHVFLKFARDGSSLATGAKFEVNTTGTAPADSVKIGTMVASGSAITSTNQSSRTRGFPRPTKGPVAVGAGSTRSHEGSVTISANQNLSGIHYYTDFTLNSGVTITVPAGKRSLKIVALGTITINGTISAASAGAPATAVSPATESPGTDQAGGGGNSGGSGHDVGGSVRIHGLIYQAGGGGGTNATQLTGSDVPLLEDVLSAMGGAAGGATTLEAGGPGGGSIVLSAPTIVLGSTATLNTSGGSIGGVVGDGPGGGGAGNVYIRARSLTDNGATFTMNGGAGGPRTFPGGNGANGTKQINLY